MTDFRDRFDAVVSDQVLEDINELFEDNYNRERNDLYNHIIHEDGYAHEVLEGCGYTREQMKDESNLVYMVSRLADKGYDHTFCRFIRIQRMAVALKDLKHG